MTVEIGECLDGQRRQFFAIHFDAAILSRRDAIGKLDPKPGQLARRAVEQQRPHRRRPDIEGDDDRISHVPTVYPEPIEPWHKMVPVPRQCPNR